jgi:hypothetical protein
MLESASLSPPFARANLHLGLVFNAFLLTKRLRVLYVIFFSEGRKQKRVEEREKK